MGTNYFVRVPECADACKHCGQAERVHLGKSSGGWLFLHRAYRHEYELPGDVDFPVMDRASWLKLLDLGPIYDEYGTEHDRDGFLAHIDSKQSGIAHNSERARELGGPYYGIGREHDFQSDGYDFCDAEFS